MKFTPEASHYPKTFVGFWRPQEGDIVRGTLIDAFDSEDDTPGFKRTKTFILELGKNEFGPHVDVSVESRDRDSNAKIVKTARAGATVGINEKANLRGLHKLVGHPINIRCLGKTKNDDGTSSYEFDVDFGAKIEEKKDKAAPAAKKKAGATA